MRIIYLHQYFNTPSMIGGTRSYAMARYLAAAGHDVQMITSWRDATSKATWFETSESGIRVHWLPVPYSNSLPFKQRIGAFFRFAWGASRKAQSLGGDVVFASSTPLTIAIPGIYASTRLRVPMVFEVRDMWPDVPIALGVLRNPLAIKLARLLERYAYIKSQHVVVLAPGMMEDIIRKGVSASKLSVIPNGCDKQLIVAGENRGEPREFFSSIGARRVILYAGTIGRANGCDYLIPLAQALWAADATIRIIVIGDGSEKAALISQAKHAGVLSRNLFILDPMPKSRLAAWLVESHIHIALMRGPQSYLKDAVNNKFFDALAAGRPVASNFEGFQSKIAAEAEVGLILDATDHERAAMQLVRALNDDTWLRTVPERAKELVDGTFNCDNLASRLEAVLLTAAGHVQ